MARNIYYRYNPETDNYERIFPSIKSRMMAMLKYGIVGIFISVVILFGIFYIFGTPSEANLRKENERLKAQYEILSRRLETSLNVMHNIQNRDDNFYRVMMQMDPLSRGERFAGLDNEARYQKFKTLNDNELVLYLTRQLDMLDRQIYAQSISFDNLRQMAVKQQEKLYHIPSIFPLKDYTLASGFGYRLDPVLGSIRFHSGMDFAATQGTPVYATADGKVSYADRKSGYGNCIEIDHGFNYVTRYCNLSGMDVISGQDIKRGEKIGAVGNSGKSAGPHLHYEVRFKDEPQNPVNYYFMGVTPEDYERMVIDAENAGRIMD
ncbi:MAG: M23 family metallopeptidase [Prevotella sp.]|nr:M23 family metallopeptidase [Bacteroides sp.]MCM1365850.1 M23 family metallopeptidase [Prevotella sp.]